MLPSSLMVTVLSQGRFRYTSTKTDHGPVVRSEMTATVVQWLNKFVKYVTDNVTFVFYWFYREGRSVLGTTCENTEVLKRKLDRFRPSVLSFSIVLLKISYFNRDTRPTDSLTVVLSRRKVTLKLELIHCKRGLRLFVRSNDSSRFDQSQEKNR